MNSDKGINERSGTSGSGILSQIQEEVWSNVDWNLPINGRKGHTCVGVRTYSVYKQAQHRHCEDRLPKRYMCNIERGTND